MRTSIETRVKVYEQILELRNNGLQDSEIINQICKKFNVPYGTVHRWCKYEKSPFWKGKLKFEKEIFYVLGALLGDGCAYYWKKKKWYMVILVGDKEFMNKYTEKLSKCTSRKINSYIMRSKNVWKAQKTNFELYSLFKRMRENKKFLLELIKKVNYYENEKEFIEGLFDAEGCVKIIKEEVRITPKICLDITNTDKELLDVAQLLLKETLDIKANYSIQNPEIGKDGFLRKKAYHLRIYKKEFVKKFFDKLSTTKLKSEKKEYLQKWLSNGKGENIIPPLLSDNFSLPVSS